MTFHAAILPCRRALAAALGAAGLLAAVPAAAPAFDPTKDRETHLLSRSLSGGFPNAPSRNGAFAQNAQGASLAAYESDASDIVAGDTNGVTDVFLVRRGGQFTDDRGEPWQPAGPAELVSQGIGGVPANGPSYKPDLDGDALHRVPHCVAFVSAADNIVPGDTNGRPDAFLKNLWNGKVERVSVGTGGIESNGTTYEVQVDGGCTRVAFTADATNLHLSKTAAGRNRYLRPLVTQAPAPGSKQVYVRFLTKTKDNRNVGGVTFLASASNRKVPGNGDSYELSLGELGDGCPKRCGTVSGDSVAFTSKATNLTGGDSNGETDVYQRTFYLPTLDYKQRRKGKKRYFKLATALVSATASGQAGNGPSSHPASNSDGEYIAFETTATNLAEGDHNDASDVVMRGMFPDSVRMRTVSHAKETGLGNGGSHDPTITSPGSILFYASDASNLQPNPPRQAGIFYDRNCMRDVFFWNTVSGNASLQSRDSDQTIPNLPENSGGTTSDRCPPHVAAGSENPASSFYGNYFLFESSYPVLDLDVARGLFPSLLSRFSAIAERSHRDPAVHQVYLRYNGPKAADATFPPSVWPSPQG